MSESVYDVCLLRAKDGSDFSVHAYTDSGVSFTLHCWGFAMLDGHLDTAGARSLARALTEAVDAIEAANFEAAVDCG